MKKVLKAVGIILLLLAIYMAAQIFATFAVGAVHAVQLVAEAAASDTMPDIGEIVNDMIRYMGSQMPWVIFIAVALTLPTYYLIYRGRKHELRAFVGFGGMHPVSVPVLLVFGLALNFIVNMLLGFLSQIDFFKHLFETYDALTDQIFGGSFLLSLVAIGIVAPIFEELLFRGLVFGELRKLMNVSLAIVLQALLFGIYHMNIIQGTYAFLIGIILGFIYYRSRSIAAPMLVHIAVNSSSLLVGQFIGDEIPDSWGGAIIAASLLLFILTGVFILTHRSFRHAMDDRLCFDNDVPEPQSLPEAAQKDEKEKEI